MADLAALEAFCQKAARAAIDDAPADVGMLLVAFNDDHITFGYNCDLGEAVTFMERFCARYRAHEPSEEIPE